MMMLAVSLLLVAGWVLTAPGSRLGRSTAPRARPRVRRRFRARARRPASDVARVLVEVASRLRAGSPMTLAWTRSLPAPAPLWAGPVLAEVGATTSVSARDPTRWQHRWRRGERTGSDVAAALAACRLASRTGAPLAEVIDVVVGGIAEAAEADELRRTALAGPRASARLLAWLPVGGVALGTMLGADPVGVLLGGGVGGLCLIGGGLLFLAGRRWVAALVADAERAGR